MVTSELLTVASSYSHRGETEMTHSSPLSTKRNPETSRDLYQSSQMKQNSSRVPVFFFMEGGSRKWNLESEYVLAQKDKRCLSVVPEAAVISRSCTPPGGNNQRPRLLCWHKS